jgi:hypothetical protein
MLHSDTLIRSVAGTQVLLVGEHKKLAFTGQTLRAQMKIDVALDELTVTPRLQVIVVLAQRIGHLNLGKSKAQEAVGNQEDKEHCSANTCGD